MEHRPVHEDPEWSAAPDDGTAFAGTGTRIGLWGARASGKTTFLAALRIAALSRSREFGQWQIIASDDASEKFLIDSSRLLTIDRQFPSSTTDPRRFSWQFLGDVTDTRYAVPRPRWFKKASYDPTRNKVDFTLNVLDASGRTFEDSYEDPNAPESVGFLSRADGLIYLVDPTKEAELGDSFGSLNGTLARMSRWCRDNDRLLGSYLPHRISVCLTKFDDPEVFERARRGGWTEEGPGGIPTVPDAEGFFDWLAGDLHGHGSTMGLVGDALRGHFRPDRIRFYVSSSIGLGSGPDGKVDLNRFGNVNDVNGQLRVIGPVRPHNVMEPVISLVLGHRKRGG